MARRPPCSSPAAERRRPARWGNYDIDHTEAEGNQTTPYQWPVVTAYGPSPANPDSYPTEPFHSQAELALRLGVSIATLARARKKGLLMGHLIGGQWRFSEQQIADYLELTKKPLRLYGLHRNDSDPS